MMQKSSTHKTHHEVRIYSTTRKADSRITNRSAQVMFEEGE